MIYYNSLSHLMHFYIPYQFGLLSHFTAGEVRKAKGSLEIKPEENHNLISALLIPF